MLQYLIFLEYVHKNNYSLFYLFWSSSSQMQHSDNLKRIASDEVFADQIIKNK